MNKVLPFFFASLFLVVACSKQPSVSQEDKMQPHSSALDWQPLAFDCLILKSKVDYKTKDNNVHATANIRVKKDSIIWISISPGMGIEVVRSIITPDSVKIINRLDNKYDKYSISYLKETLGIDLNFYNLQNLLVGDLLLPLQKTDLLTENNNNEETWSIGQQRNDLWCNSIISKSEKKVRQLTAKNQEGKSLLVEYANFAFADSILFHQTQNLTVVNNNDTSFIEVNYQKVEFTSKEISFPFSVPKKYEK